MVILLLLCLSQQNFCSRLDLIRIMLLLFELPEHFCPWDQIVAQNFFWARQKIFEFETKGVCLDRKYSVHPLMCFHPKYSVPREIKVCMLILFQLILIFHWSLGDSDPFVSPLNTFCALNNSGFCIQSSMVNIPNQLKKSWRTGFQSSQLTRSRWSKALSTMLESISTLLTMFVISRQMHLLSLATPLIGVLNLFVCPFLHLHLNATAWVLLTKWKRPQFLKYFAHKTYITVDYGVHGI